MQQIPSSRKRGGGIIKYKYTDEDCACNTAPSIQKDVENVWRKNVFVCKKKLRLNQRYNKREDSEKTNKFLGYCFDANDRYDSRFEPQAMM